jgi:hypothetical protein
MRFMFAIPLFVAVLIRPAFADVDKVATACEAQICFHWWPKLPSVEGWGHDRANSLHFNFNALAPVGKTFSDAETVMYANAVYKPRVPQDKTLTSFIEGDLQKFRDENPELKVIEESPLKTADGKLLQVFRLSPLKQGQWERVAYLDEGDYYIDFVISSRSEKGLSESSRAYEALIKSYREKP